jgi:hypothetical protein
MARNVRSKIRTRSVAVALSWLALLAMAVPAANAAGAPRYSGTVAAIDHDRGVMLVDEVGPWRVERGATVTTRRTIRLTPGTQYRLFMRVDRPGAFPGDFIEVALAPTDFGPGDFVTVECARGGERLVAVTVTVAELPLPGETR